MARFLKWHSPTFQRMRPALRLVALLLPIMVMLPHVLGLLQYAPITRLEQQIYDVRLRWQAKQVNQQDARIVIVDIDEASLQHEGRWPWSRNTLAQLAQELLKSQQVAVLGFDILLTDADRTAGRTGDQYLEQVLTGSPAVLGFYYNTQNPIKTGVLPNALQLEQTAQDNGLSSIEAWHGYTGIIPELVKAVSWGGFLNAATDSDGVLRSIPLLVRGDGDERQAVYPALSLAMYMRALQVPSAKLITAQVDNPNAAIQGLQLQQNGQRFDIPVGKNGSFLVPFKAIGADGRQSRFRYISAADVLDGKLQPGELANKLVLIGTSAPGLRDVHTTPIRTNYPGVEVHASALSAMLDGQFMQVPDYKMAFELLNLLLLGGLFAFLLMHSSAIQALGWGLALLLLQVSLITVLALSAGLILPLVSGLLTLLAMYVVHITMGYVREQANKRVLVHLFGRYVPPELARRMANSPTSYSMQARSAQLTVMFCDVQGFTRLSETMEPTQLQALLNEVFNRIADVIVQHGGTIDKFMGDCVMVFWGAPLEDAKHALHGVQTAIGIQHMLRDFNQQRKQQGLEPLHVSIGLNTGMMSVGDMGTDLRRNYTVIGDAVNLASRLEGMAKLYGQAVVVGESTKIAVPEEQWRWIDFVKVVGKEQAVNVYSPIALEDSVYLTQELALWETFRTAWLTGQQTSCLDVLQQLRQLRPNYPLYELYAQRVAKNMAAAATDVAWEPVSQMQAKQFHR